MSETVWDYVIIGAGVLGSAIAMYLKTQDRKSTVLMVDKYPSAGQGNTIKSNAAYRNVFDTSHNVIMCTTSINYYKAIEQQGTNLGIKETGYLWLLSARQHEIRNRKTIPMRGKMLSLSEFLEENSIPSRFYNEPELTKALPEVVTSFDQDHGEFRVKPVNITNGFLGHQCGSLAPDLLVRHYEQEFRKLGGKTLYLHEVIKLLLKEKEKEFDPDFISTVWQDPEIGAIQCYDLETKAEKTIQAKNFILATGAWINQLLDPLGYNCGVKPKKRQLFRICGVKDFVTNNNFVSAAGCIPFTILPIGGVFIKPLLEAGCVDVGVSDDIGRRFETRLRNTGQSIMENTHLDHPNAELDFFIYSILPILQMYFPKVFTDNIKVLDQSAGMYAYSMDKNPVIEKISSLGNLTYVSGASGSGIMKADAIARICVGAIIDASQVELFGGQLIDVEDFGLKERNLPKETLVL